MDVHAGLHLYCLHTRTRTKMVMCGCAGWSVPQKIKITQAKHQEGYDVPNQVPFVFGVVDFGANVGIGVNSVLCA